MWIIRRLCRRTNKASLILTLLTLFGLVIAWNILLTFVLQTKSSGKWSSGGSELAREIQIETRLSLLESNNTKSTPDRTSVQQHISNLRTLPGFTKPGANANASIEFVDSFINIPKSGFFKDLQKDNVSKIQLLSGESNKKGRNGGVVAEKATDFADVARPDSPGAADETNEADQRMWVTLEEYRSGARTGNPLIDDYGKNNLKDRGEMGKPVVLTPGEQTLAEKALSEFNVNTVASDAVPLNRLVPDSRISKCDQLQYNTSHLPTASIIIPFYDEWPSLLLRTVYSVINRSPRHLVKDIILIDDASTLEQLKKPLEKYIAANFPKGLVRLVRVPERSGLIKARMRGTHEATGDVLIFFDSHMEVNIDWIQPLLTEISMDNTVVAMSTLDYVQRDTLEYKYNYDYLTRYGWNWRMVFFETFFRDDQIGPDPRKPREGATMVGAAFAVDKKFFLHLGGYDEAMSVWGGENLEMGWRVWLCGGRLMHLPCSRIGHVPRGQPYSFPGGREHIEHFNYKRAISVWMGNYTRFIYNIFPDMKDLNVGDISARLDLKSKLGCKEFKWYLDKVWPELAIFDEDIQTWGHVRNEDTGTCLDNNDHLFQYEAEVYLEFCNGTLDRQAFALTNDNLLKTSLQCVVCHDPSKFPEVMLEDCVIGTRDKWKYTPGQRLLHIKSKLCLGIGPKGPRLESCSRSKKSQIWIFRPFQL
ncbi:Polypeptide N-acetylgalactosaminyltransferase 3 [Bulinus truncatus]|nr:Polypeptide N-acetylgalactosaminyltransferase 3 [Bulinus truncatus]